MKTIHSFKLLLVFLLPLLFHIRCQAQVHMSREKYQSSGFNVGFFGHAFSSHQNLEGKNYLSRTTSEIVCENGRGQSKFTGTTSLGINKSFFWKDKKTRNFSGIQFELQQNHSSYLFLNSLMKTPPGPPDNDDDDFDSLPSRLLENDKYLKFSTAIQRLWYLSKYSPMIGNSYFYWKESFGLTFFHRNQGKVIGLNDQESFSNSNDYSMTAKTTSINQRTLILGTEFGFRFFNLDKSRSIDVGLVLYHSFSPIYTREYEFFKTQIPTITQPFTKISVGKSTNTFNGSSILLNATYCFNSKVKSHPLDSLKFIDKPKPVSNSIAHIHQPHILNGRSVKIQEKIKVGDSTIVAEVWDKGIIDGDIISLYLNGKEILHDFTVGKSKNELVLHLKPGSNFLVMHALNLGRIPPNTAAIEIIDDVKHTEIILNSNTKKSGALEIIYKPSSQTF